MGYHGMLFLFNLPLLFASNALYPLGQMPGWIRVLALLNPTTYLIDATRATAFGGSASIPLWVSMVILLLLAVAGTMLALASFRRTIR
jgi:ABC-2 type transport system permease protein